MTETTTETITITPQSRNLSFGWDNKPRQMKWGLGFDPAPAPTEQGGLATLRRQMAECRRINSGNDYARSFFVGGQRVVSGDYAIDALLTAMLDPECPPCFKFATVEVEA